MIALLIAVVPVAALVLLVAFVLVDAACELIADLAAKRHYAIARKTARP